MDVKKQQEVTFYVKTVVGCAHFCCFHWIYGIKTFVLGTKKPQKKFQFLKSNTLGQIYVHVVPQIALMEYFCLAFF